MPLIDGRSDSGIGLRLSNERVTGVGAVVLRADLGLEPVLGLPFGLNDGAFGLGRNSMLFGFSLAAGPTLATPLDRREKLGSTILAGPVGGRRVS